MNSQSNVYLKRQAYGKDHVRLVKVFKEPGNPEQSFVELTVRVLLQGDFETSYTKADNSKVVATDSVKNTVYVLAKDSPNVAVPELFALEIGKHFLDTYAHVHNCQVRIKQHRWARLVQENGIAHPHSFQKLGDEVRFTEAVVAKSSTPGASSYEADLSSGIQGLVVLKTTGSGFTNFLRDRFTTLGETEDRILCTSVTATYNFQAKTLAGLIGADFDRTYQLVRNVTLNRFANDYSASVQATIYDMAQEILQRCAALEQVSYELPNKHVFTIDLKPFGKENQGAHSTVFMPFDAPAGLITATIARSQNKAKL